MLTLDITITHSAVPPTEGKHNLCNSFMRNNNGKLLSTSEIQVRTISRSCSAPRLQQIVVHTVLIKTNNLKLHDNDLIYLHCYLVLHCRSRPTENLTVKGQVKTSESCLLLSNFKNYLPCGLHMSAALVLKGK